MSEAEIEITDVVVVLQELDDAETAKVVDILKQLGLTVDAVDHENSIVEGSIYTDKLHALHQLEPVRYVRNVATYVLNAGNRPTDPDDDSD